MDKAEPSGSALMYSSILRRTGPGAGVPMCSRIAVDGRARIRHREYSIAKITEQGGVFAAQRRIPIPLCLFFGFFRLLRRSSSKVNTSGSSCLLYVPRRARRGRAGCGVERGQRVVTARREATDFLALSSRRGQRNIFLIKVSRRKVSRFGKV